MIRGLTPRKEPSLTFFFSFLKSGNRDRGRLLRFLFIVFLFISCFGEIVSSYTFFFNVFLFQLSLRLICKYWKKKRAKRSRTKTSEERKAREKNAKSGPIRNKTIDLKERLSHCGTRRLGKEQGNK